MEDRKLIYRKEVIFLSEQDIKTIDNLDILIDKLTILKNSIVFDKLSLNCVTYEGELSEIYFDILTYETDIEYIRRKTEEEKIQKQKSLKQAEEKEKRRKQYLKLKKEFENE